jgi:hypothetical protein
VTGDRDDRKYRDNTAKLTTNSYYYSLSLLSVILSSILLSIVYSMS